MTDPTATPASTPAPQPPRRRSRLFIVTVALVAALTGGVVTTAVSEGGFRHGMGFGPGHWRQGGMMNADPAQIESRVDRAVRHLAVEIDATPEQQEKLRGIVRAAVRDLLPLREKAQAARRARQFLTQQSIDRAAVETFRAEQMALADAASKRFTQALVEAAEVLTPEQRRKIDDHLSSRRGYWRGWQRG